jgi:TonB family protein
VLGDDPKMFDQLLENAIGRHDVSFLEAAVADDLHVTNDRQTGRAPLNKQQFLASVRVTPVSERTVDSLEVKEEGALIDTSGHIRVRSGANEHQEYFARRYRRGPSGWELVTHRIVRQVDGSQAPAAGTGSGIGPPPPHSQDALRPGNGVMLPRLIKDVKPHYTSEAMRAKVQGAVLVECVVLTDGTVGDLKVVRSLDKVYGLDEEAIKAAKQWRFAPGTREGVPVPVLITIELTFTLGK